MTHADVVSPEIEITPEMIGAGEDVLGLFDPEYDSRRETVVAMFTAMVLVSRAHRNIVL